MFEEARNSVTDTTRRGLALYFGAVNLAGETITNPRKVLRGIERRGEKVLDRIETNNTQIRRSVSLLQRRTTETASSVRGTARATVGLASTMADDVTATAPRTRKSSTSRRRSTSARSRVAGAARTSTRGTTGSTSSRTSSTRKSASGRTTATGTSAASGKNTAEAKQRSQAAQKAARTRALNERKAELKKARTLARAKATRAKNESKTALNKAGDSVQHGFQVVGQSLENVGERIERSVEKVAS
ncbi:MAG: hypothetical protein ABR573_00090 [Candidatus Dormibacteria bacterium]